ncbi:MAG TPA: type II secretion system protein GspE, partial [Candidatus Omnitrophota bacterium]|nr:type II secretion system protein GspE [Candidatus Omnitrophota bacterium]
MRINALLGDLLVEKGAITRTQLNQALTQQKNSREPLGQVLIQMGLLDEAQLRMVLSEQLGVSFLTANQLKPRTDQRLKECIPPDFALANLVLPLDRQGQVLKVAVAKVPDIIFLDNLRKITGLDIVTVLSTENELRRAIEAYYSSTDLQEFVS